MTGMSAALWAASRVLSRELVSRLRAQVWSTVVVVSLSPHSAVRLCGGYVPLRDVEPRDRAMVA